MKNSAPFGSALLMVTFSMVGALCLVVLAFGGPEVIGLGADSTALVAAVGIAAMVLIPVLYIAWVAVPAARLAQIDWPKLHMAEAHLTGMQASDLPEAVKGPDQDYDHGSVGDDDRDAFGYDADTQGDLDDPETLTGDSRVTGRAQNIFDDDTAYVLDMMDSDELHAQEAISGYGWVLGPIGAYMEKLAGDAQSLNDSLEARAAELESERFQTQKTEMEHLMGELRASVTVARQDIVDAGRTTVANSRSAKEALTSLTSNLDELRNITANSLGALSTTVTTQCNDFKHTVKDDFGALQEFVRTSFDGVSTVTKSAEDSLKDHIREAHDTLRDDVRVIATEFEGATTAMATTARNIQDAMRNDASEVQDNIRIGAASTIASLNEDLAGMRTSLQDAFGQLGEVAQSIHASIGDDIKDANSAVVDELATLKGRIGDIADSVQDNAAKALSDMTESASRFDTDSRAVVGQIADLYTRIAPDADRLNSYSAKLQDLNTDMLQASLESLTGAVDRITAFSTEGEDAMQRLAGAAETFDGKLGSMEEAMTEAAKTLQNSSGSLDTVADSAKDSIADFLQKLKTTAFTEYQSLKEATTATKQEVEEQQSMFRMMGRNLVTMSDRLILECRETHQTVVDTFKADTGAATTSFAEAAKEAVTALSGQNDTVFSEITARVETALGDITEGGKAATDALAADIGAVRDSIETALEEVTASSKTAVTAVSEEAAAIRGHADTLMQTTSKDLESKITDMTNALAYRITETGAQMDTFTQSAEEKILGPAGQLQDLLNTDGGSLASLAESLQSTLTRGQDAMDVQLEKLSASTAASDALIALTRSIEDGLQKHGDMLGSTTEKVLRIAEDVENQLPGGLASANSALDALVAEISGNRDALRYSLGSYAKVVGQLDSMISRLDGVDFDRQRVDMDELTKTMKAVARNIPTMGQDVVTQVGRQLAAPVNAMQSAVDDARASMEQLGTLDQRIASANSDGIAALEEHVDGIATTLTAVQDMITQSSSDAADHDKKILRAIGQVDQHVSQTMTQSRIGDVLDQLGAVRAQIETLVSAQATDDTQAGPVDLPDTVLRQISGIEKTAMSLSDTLRSQHSLLTGLAKAQDSDADSGPDMGSLIANLSGTITGDITALQQASSTALGQQIDTAINSIRDTLSEVASSAAKASDSDTDHSRALAEDFAKELAQQEERQAEQLGRLQDQMTDLQASLQSVSSEVAVQNTSLASLPAMIESLQAHAENGTAGQDAGQQGANGTNGSHSSNGHSSNGQGSNGQGSNGQGAETIQTEISSLFTELEQEAENVAESLMNTGDTPRKTSDVKAALSHLNAKRDQVETWSKQLRNVSTAMALVRDAENSKHLN